MSTNNRDTTSVSYNADKLEIKKFLQSTKHTTVAARIRYDSNKTIISHQAPHPKSSISQRHPVSNSFVRQLKRINGIFTNILEQLNENLNQLHKKCPKKDETYLNRFTARIAEQAFLINLDSMMAFSYPIATDRLQVVNSSGS